MDSKSNLAGFRGWTNPDRFIHEIEILLEENARLRGATPTEQELLRRIDYLENEQNRVPETVLEVKQAEELLARAATKAETCPTFTWQCINCQLRIQTYCDFHINQRPICVQCNAEMDPGHSPAPAPQTEKL